MAMRSLKIAVLFLFTISLNAYVPKVIYGEDNRREYFEVADETYRELSRSTVALTSVRNLNQRGSITEISGRKVGDVMNLCKDEPYREQPFGAHCSGFLVGPKTIVTAGHCVQTAADCRNTKFVFDYKKESQGQRFYEVPTQNVYSCGKLIKSVVNSGYGGDNNDYAVVELDRVVTDRSPLTFRRSGKIANDEDLVVMGHPSGLPLKIADGAYVRNNDNSIYFRANLDTYGGNSGSAVFNATTGEVEGILVNGDEDYVKAPGKSCYVSNICPASGCLGEGVTRITNIKEIKKL